MRRERETEGERQSRGGGLPGLALSLLTVLTSSMCFMLIGVWSLEKIISLWSGLSLQWYSVRVGSSESDRWKYEPKHERKRSTIINTITSAAVSSRGTYNNDDLLQGSH